MYRIKRKNAPLLASRERREKNSHKLPDDVKRILQILVRDERRSVSWIIEQILVTHLNLDIDYKVKVIKRK